MKFYKVQASGNDFVLIDCLKKAMTKAQLVKFTKNVCDRKFSIGADGVLVVEKSKKADFKMRILNADGSEAEMCGNGARCFAFWVCKHILKKSTAITFETLAGIICAEVKLSVKREAGSVKGDSSSCEVKIGLSDPKDLQQDIKLKVADKNMLVNFVNTGVPHAVVIVDDIEKIDVKKYGSAIRYHEHFKPKGTNANFIQIVNESKILIRTYERGVEDETLSCGTGTCASSIITALKKQGNKDLYKVDIVARSGELLKVDFSKDENDNPVDVWMQGKAYEVFNGEICL